MRRMLDPSFEAEQEFLNHKPPSFFLPKAEIRKMSTHWYSDGLTSFQRSNIKQNNTDNLDYSKN